MQVLKTIPLVEPSFKKSYAEAVHDQIVSGFVGPGQRTQEFAKALATFAGIPHCLLTVSGTIALSIAARTLGLQPGDEILVPSYGVISTINAFSSIGLEPKLVDIDKTTGCISIAHLLQTISEKTRAVCFVNFSGYTGSNLVEIKEICDQRGIPLIEDAACALGHHYNGMYAGTFGTIGIYSFSTPKVLTTGQGGALLTYNTDLFEKAAAFIDHGDLQWRKTNVTRSVGTNLRYNDILSALGVCQLNDIKQRLEHRRTIFHVLKQELDEYIYSVPGEEAPLHNIIFSTQPDFLTENLREQGIQTTRQYRTLSMHPAYQKLATRPYLNSEFWTNHAVYLPFGMTLTIEDAHTIAQAIKDSKAELIKP